MPGLIRGVARVGAATAVSNRVSRRQAGRWAEQDQQAAEQEEYAPEQEPPAEEPTSAAPDPVEQLTKLGQLRDQGVLTDAEFEAEKAKIIG